MPNIRQYDAGNLALRPTETGIEARAAAARRIGATYNQVGGAEQQLGQETAQLGAFKAHVQEQFGGHLAQGISDAGSAAVRYMDHQQISHGALGLAGLFANATQEWNETAKNGDPNDPTLAKQFLEQKLEPALNKFREGFTTERAQQWAESHIDNLRQHFFTKTSADMSTLAGQAVALNHRQTVNQLSNTVRQDPSALDFAINTVEGATNGVVNSSPNLTGEQAGRARSELMQQGKEALVKSAVMGLIEKNPDVDLAAIEKKYGAYITPAEIKQFQNAARYYDRIGKQEARDKQVLFEHGARVDFNRQISALEASTMPQNVGDRATLPADYWIKLRELSKHPGAALEPGRLKSMVANGEAITNRLNKPEPRNQVSHQTTVELLRSMRATDETRVEGQAAVDAIYKRYDEGKLNTADFRFLNTEAQNLRTPEGQALNRERTEFFKRYSLAIDPGMGVTAEGGQKIYAAEMGARQQEEALRRKGLDPHLVYDPRSEYFFGNPQNLSRYQGSLQDALHEQQPQQAPKPQPAESEPMRPRTKTEREALPPGTPYKAPDGSTRIRQ